MSNTALNYIAGIACVVAGLTGLYFHIDYSGWALCVGLFMVVFG